MDVDWRHRANCRGADPDFMAPEAATPDDLAAALGMCVNCPVSRECDALRAEQAEPYGVWAGEWFGDPPANPELSQCQWCGDDIENGSRGVARVYCGGTCRQRARRARLLVA